MDVSKHLYLVCYFWKVGTHRLNRLFAQHSELLERNRESKWVKDLSCGKVERVPDLLHSLIDDLHFTKEHFGPLDELESCGLLP
jgi:hypothetical protein